MKNRILSITIVALTTLFFSCNNSSKTETKTVTVRQEWFPNANYAGELVAAREFAKDENIEIKIEAGSDNIDPIKLVLSGKNDFGVVGADKVMIANEKGANLVIVGVINYNSPTCFLALSQKNISKPSDFVGKKVGVLTGTATEYVYRAMLNQSNIDLKEITEVEAPFDLASFIAGAYDVRPAFIYDEPVSLDMQGIPYTIIQPSDYGVSFVGTVYFTTKSMIERNPDIVQSFVNAVAKGWEKAIRDPVFAIELLKEYDSNIDSKREIESLKKGLEYFVGYNENVLTSDISHWNNMCETMVELGLIERYNLGSTIDTTFIYNYHKSNINAAIK